MLASFEIERFRTFEHLRIDRLARVNLVVGRNNVGKTMLLEALRFYVSGDLSHLARLLREREEVVPAVGDGHLLLRFEALAHGRPRSPVEVTIRLLDPSAPERALDLVITTANKQVRAKRGATGAWGGFWWDDFSNRDTAIDRPAFVPQTPRIAPGTLGWQWDAVVLGGGEDRVIPGLYTKLIPTPGPLPAP